MGANTSHYDAFPRTRRGTIGAAIAALCAALAAPVAASEQPPEVRLVIQNHRFSPSELRLPAGRKLKLVVENRDATPEEFESYELNREKVVPGGATVRIYIGPLEPGRYPFFGDFNASTARGVVVAE